MTDSSDQAEFMPTDAQSHAFRGATNADYWNDDINTLVQREGAVYHKPITDVSEVRPPEYHEAEGWDDDRNGPKSITEARNALADRIADPNVPDTDSEVSAYDGLEA